MLNTSLLNPAIKVFTLYRLETSKPGTSASSEDPDEIPQNVENVAFHQDLHCLLRQN